LQVEGADVERLGHLQTLALPGADRAAREPWRVAAGILFALGRADDIERRWPGPAAATVRQMLERDLHTPRTSSAGRWFDAAAGLLGVATCMSFEGQAAMRMEGLAEAHGSVTALENGYTLTPEGTLDLLPLLAALSEEQDASYGAALFHATLVEALCAWTERAAAHTGLSTVALGGGCFLNHLLRRELEPRLEARGIRVLQARQAPPNDGGIALGQAWVARQTMHTT
jgi:hydrogenase maturation protein HypF